MNVKNLQIKGRCKGVKLIPRGVRGVNDDHVCLQLMTEDDEVWRDSGSSFSSYWLDELITILQTAKHEIETNCKPDIYENKQYGWKF